MSWGLAGRHTQVLRGGQRLADIQRGKIRPFKKIMTESSQKHCLITKRDSGTGMQTYAGDGGYHRRCKPQKTFHRNALRGDEEVLEWPQAIAK
jgi:hypothetical protein